jgi:hypothetical protein
MSSFTITTPSATVNLSPSSVKGRETAKGTVTYSVTNKTGATVRTALRVKPSSGAEPSWFTVRGGEERDVGPGKTEDFAIELSVPGTAAKPEIPAEQRPQLSFHAAAVNLKNPDNDAESGSAVAFQAPVLTASDFKLKWWMIAAPVALILVVVGAFFGLQELFKDRGEVELADWTTKTVEEARSALEDQGLQVSERNPSQLEPAVGVAKFYQRTVQSQDPAAGKVAPASAVELVWEWTPLVVAVPDLSGQTLQNAIPLVENNGLRFVAAQDPPQPQPPNNYPVVSSWSPTGSVAAGTGITLTMRWQASRPGLDHVVILGEYSRFREKATAEFMRRRVEPE